MLKENVMISRETAVDVSSGLVFRLILFNILTNVCEKNLEVFKNRMMTKKRWCNIEEDRDFSERTG